MEDLLALILERSSPKPVAEIGRLLSCHLPVHPTMEMHLTLYCAEPPRPAGEGGPEWRWSPLRIAKNDFDYSCLQEQKQTHSLDNFLILLEDVLAYLPEAWNREAVGRFLSELDPLKILHSKEEETENFDRWMLEWVRIECAERGAERTA